MEQSEKEIGRFAACHALSSVHQQIAGVEYVANDALGIAGFAIGADGLPLHCAISVASWNSACTLRLHGTLDVYAEPFLKERIEQFIEKSGVNSLILDLTYCEFTDSTGLIQLVLIYRELKQVGRKLRLKHLSPQTKATFNTIGFDNVIATME